MISLFCEESEVGIYFLDFMGFQVFIPFDLP